MILKNMESSIRQRMEISIARHQKQLWDERSESTVTGSFPIPLEIIKRYVSHEKSRVLDAGCGSGWKTLELRRLGFDIIGWDLNEEGFQRAQQQGLHEFNLHLFSRLNISFRLAQELHGGGFYRYFDAVLFQAVLTDLLPYGVHNAEKNLREIVKPGGVVIASDFLRNDLAYSLLPESCRQLWAERYSRDAFYTGNYGTIVVLKNAFKGLIDVRGISSIQEFFALLEETHLRAIDHYAKHWTLEELQTLFSGFTLEEHTFVLASTKRHTITGVIAVWRKI
jgi:2-polyprenyl-3-methyl-5-hydroxy-6-metoxy-1,4-benzoquinol methylase